MLLGLIGLMGNVQAQFGDYGVKVGLGWSSLEDDLATEAQTALQQIKDRDYDAELRAQGAGQILHYGIAFCGKRVQVELQ